MRLASVVAVAAVVVPLAAHAEAPPACPVAMGVVDRDAGPALVYLPADPARPEACRLVGPGGVVGEFWFGSWKTDWPGADAAAVALRRAYAGGPGTVERFDTVAAPGYSWHETIRNDGFEDLNVAGAVRRTMKVSHVREGFDGNTYHSVITQWKEMATGMTVYQNYNHIAGAPVPGMTWNPVLIAGGR